MCAAFAPVTEAPFRVVMPLQRTKNVTTEGFLHRAFHEIVDSTDYFIPQEGITACNVPAFGQDVRVSLTAAPPNLEVVSDDEKRDCFVLSVDGSHISESDFGWICAKFYECKSAFEETLDLSRLRSVVASHFTKNAPPHPGYQPKSFGTKPLKEDLNPQVLQILNEQGYVVIDDVFPKTYAHQHAQLSAYLQEKTNQRNTVRRDTVHFLRQEEAAACGIQEHFTNLMSIATHLNRHHELRKSSHSAISPATEAEPLTVPPAIQLAEYGENDFYVEHSDNSLAPCGLLRNNFRHYTCILYLNSDWDSDMGGALRLYLNSRQYASPQDAVANCEHVDILPENGRLLIFDSCLVHAVERVTQGEQVRRALTLWINRPNDSGVAGEVFY